MRSAVVLLTGDDEAEAARDIRVVEVFLEKAHALRRPRVIVGVGLLLSIATIDFSVQKSSAIAKIIIPDHRLGCHPRVHGTFEDLASLFCRVSRPLGGCEGDRERCDALLHGSDRTDGRSFA
jgi:hypothetical protein